MFIGYARISTKDQNLDLQIDGLKNSGCEKIYFDVSSGSKSSRPQLDDMVKNIRKGDVIVIYKLDRLGRSLKHLIDFVNEMEQKGIGLKTLTGFSIDTTTPHGKFTFNIFAALSEFERDLIRERTNAGLLAARARGRMGGRPKGLSKDGENKAMVAEILYKEGKLSVQQIANQLGISKKTLYLYLRHRNVEITGYKTRIKNNAGKD